MGIDELCALPVADLAAPDSALFLWVTFPQLPEALRLIEAWGFRYKSVAFVWLDVYKRQLEDLEHRVSEHSAATESLKKTLDEQTARMKAIKQLYDSSAAFQSLKPVYDGLQKIKFEKPRDKYKAEHEAELIQFYAARRKLTGEFPDGKVDMKKLSD